MLARTASIALVLVASLAPLSFAAGGQYGASLPGPAYGSYRWPVEGPVIRRFEAPSGPFGPGHRGIDIAADPGTAVRAAADGVVAFAGRVAGEVHVSIDHPDGVRTGYSFLSSITVRAGDPVEQGAVVGSSGAGHPGAEPSHLHFGARYAGTYIDPILLLERESLVGLIHLAPIEDGAGSRAGPP